MDADSQVIVAAELTNRPTDVTHLIGVVDEVRWNTGQPPRDVSAAAGHFSENNVTTLADRGIEVLIPPEKVRHR